MLHRSPLESVLLALILVTLSACGTGPTPSNPDVGAVDAGRGVDAASLVDANADVGVLMDTGNADTGNADGGNADTAVLAVDSGVCPAPTRRGSPSSRMSFFVTSSGNGAAGGNYGGLVGADTRCQSLADAAGLGTTRTWHAYLSTALIATVPGSVLVNARDRIGLGPWYDFNGDMVAASVADLHAGQPAFGHMFTEQGMPAALSEHDILTGSQPDGSAYDTDPATGGPAPTCNNWTSNSATDNGFVGHTNASCADVSIPSWNSAHAVQCDPAGLLALGGTGRLFCFAIN